MNRVSFKEILELMEANQKSAIIKTVNDGTNLKSIAGWPSKIVCAGRVIKDNNYPYGVEMFNPGIILEFHYKEASNGGGYNGCSVTACLENKKQGEKYVTYNEFYSSCLKLWRLFDIQCPTI